MAFTRVNDPLLSGTLITIEAVIKYEYILLRFDKKEEENEHLDGGSVCENCTFDIQALGGVTIRIDLDLRGYGSGGGRSGGGGEENGGGGGISNRSGANSGTGDIGNSGGADSESSDIASWDGGGNGAKGRSDWDRRLSSSCRFRCELRDGDNCVSCTECDC
jgi:hypothetical protein